jgi:ribose transport system permease protein
VSTETTSETSAPEPDAMRVSVSNLAEAAALPTLTVLLALFFTILPETSNTFPTSENFKILLGNQAALIVIAMAALIPLMAGEYDFSVGANAGLGAIFGASAFGSGASIPVVLLLCIGIGSVVGLVNGLLITRVKVNSVVTTLGTATLIAGVVGWKSNGLSLTEGIPDTLINLTTTETLGIPDSFIIALLTTAGVYYLLRHTPFGRYLDAIGANLSAARLLGVAVDTSVLVSFVIAGALACSAGLLLIAQTGSASPSIGPGFTLPAIAAAFLSVAAIVPGRFNVWGTLVAIIFLAILNSGLTLVGASSYVNDFANGGALIVGVALASLLGRRRRDGA